MSNIVRSIMTDIEGINEIRRKYNQFYVNAGSTTFFPRGAAVKAYENKYVDPDYREAMEELDRLFPGAK